MASLKPIRNDIVVAPTCMDLTSELEFCRRLMSIEHAELANKRPLVADVFERLCEAHMDSIYEMRSTEDTAFFVTWLEQLAEAADFSLREAEIDSMINTQPDHSVSRTCCQLRWRVPSTLRPPVAGYVER